MSLTAPFPQYGGKRRWASDIWQRLGDPTVYVEPFAGSLAVLLSRPTGAGEREIVCDTNGHICNFWRAVTQDPEAVAHYADWPTFHQDLTARHKWLRDWGAEHAAEITEDPEYCDAKAAGWWVWGISLWIGGAWCGSSDDKRPHVYNTSGGRGVSAQRDQIPRMSDKTGGRGVSAQRDQIPHVANELGGMGVSAQRKALTDKRPYVRHKPGGQGVSAQRRDLGARAARHQSIVDWFVAIQDRLFGVAVLNRPWESALSPTLLMHTPSSAKPPVGVFMDPPYRTTERKPTLYQSDIDGESDDTAVAAYAWAVANGGTFRIAYACHEGDFDIPPGWTYSTKSMGAIHRPDRKKRRDLIMFSPACIQESSQGGLL